MFWKRVLHTCRNWLITVTQLCVPMFFTVMVLVILRTLPKPQDSPQLTLNTSHFGENTVLYSNGRNPSEQDKKLGEIYAKQFAVGTFSTPREIDLSDGSMDDYLLSLSEEDLVVYNSKYLIAAQIKTTKTTGYFNAQAYHAAPMALNAISNCLLKYSSNSSRSVVTINHPLPRTVADELNEMATQGYDGSAIAVNVLFGMAFLTSSFVVFLIQERAVNAKHCQFMSGVGSWTFWAATFTWDIINYVVPCILITVIFVAFDIPAYTDDGRYMYIMLLFMLYGWAVLPFMYLLSFLFTVPASGFIWLSMLNIITGM